MVAANEKRISFAEAAISDFTDSARLESLWKNMSNGGRSTGRGPSSAEMVEREQGRQDVLMNTFINNVDEVSSHLTTQIEPEITDNQNDQDVDAILKRKRSHRPDKDNCVEYSQSSGDEENIPPSHSAPMCKI